MVMLRHLLAFLDASSSATGIDFTRDDDDLANMTTTYNATGNETGDWTTDHPEDYAFQSLGFYLTLAVFLSLFLIPLCCVSYARMRRSVQPVDTDAAMPSASSRTRPGAAVAMTKEDLAKRLDELQDTFAKREVQKVSHIRLVDLELSSRLRTR